MKREQLIQKKLSRLVKMVVACLAVMTLCLFLSGSSSKAAGSYQIRINKQQNCVTIYKLNVNGKYKPVKAMICSTGAATKLGTFSLGEKIRWHVLDGPCYGQYCTRIYGGVLFHSVWYTGQNNPATLSVYSYNKLGTMASHGCVRLTVEDAKWIYDNVPSGTSVIIYNSSNPGPLGKPKSIQLPYSTPWDPTDIWSPNNPWKNKKPFISGAKNKVVDFNSDFNVLKGVKALNTTGFDATDRIKTKITYSGKRVKKVNTRRPGVYKVTYKVLDEIKRKASVTVRIRVTAAKVTPKIANISDLYVKSKSKLTKGFALKNVKVTQKGKTLNKKYIKVTYKKLKKNVYRVIYIAQNSSNQAKATAKVYIDSKAPNITGVKNGSSYDVGSTVTVNKEYSLSLITVSDHVSKLTTSDVVVTIIHEESQNRYKVTYSVKDQAGNTTKVTIYLVVVSEEVSIQGASDMTVSTTSLGYDSKATQEQIQTSLSAFLLNSAGIKAYSGSIDITSNLQVSLTVVNDTTYQAVYHVKDSRGKTASQTITVTVVKEDVAKSVK